MGKLVQVGAVVRVIGGDEGQVRIVRIVNDRATCSWTDADGVAYYKIVHVSRIVAVN